MTLDLEGRLHVAWYNVLNLSQNQSDNATPLPGQSFDLLEYSARSLDGEWTPVNDIQSTSETGYTVRNAMTVTNDGILHTVYRYVTYHVYTNSYSRTAWDASSWSAPTRMDDSGYYLNVKADRNNILHMAYNGKVIDLDSAVGEGNLEQYECAACGDIIYLRSTDEGRTWSAPRTLTFTPNTGSEKMDFLETRNGRLFLYWDEGLDWYVGRGKALDVRYIYTDDGGLTWSQPHIFAGEFPDKWYPIQIAMTEMQDGTLIAAWRYDTEENRSIYYQLSVDRGATWSDPEAIPEFYARHINDTPLDDYAIVADQNNSVHLFAVGYPDPTTTGHPALYDLTFRQGLWLRPQRIFYSSEMRPEWPKAVAGLTNDIHVTWFTRGLSETATSSVTGDLKIFYSHLESTVPLLATQAFEPTRTPLPSPTPFQALRPTLTPFPTVESVFVGTLSTGDQYASSTIIAGLGAATLFCGLILLLFRLRH